MAETTVGGVLFHKMNELEVAFWLFFGVAFAFTRFNSRGFGTFSQQPSRSLNAA